MFKREKKHRLDRTKYKGFVRVSYTICAENKNKIFYNACICDGLLQILKETLDKNKVKNWIYVFMPDYIHLVVEGRSPESDLWKTIKEFKQKSRIWFNKKGFIGERLQEDYYDHIHREEDDLVEQMVYIAANPVRAGLVEKWDKYKYVGSLHEDLNVLLNSI